MSANGLFSVLLCFISAVPASSEIVPLVLPAGTPLQVKIEKRVRIKGVNQQIKCRMVQPVFLFNKEVIPAGSEVIAHVVRLSSIRGQKRFKAILNGDFTPLKSPEIQFDVLKLPGGVAMALKTGIASQWGVIAPCGKRMQARETNSLIGGTFERVRIQLLSVRQEIATEINSQPKWDRLQEEAYSRLPYHPQFLRANTQIFRAAHAAAQLRYRAHYRKGNGASGAASARYCSHCSSTFDSRFQHECRVQGVGHCVGTVLFGRPPSDSARGYSINGYGRTGTTGRLVSAFGEIAVEVPANGIAGARSHEEPSGNHPGNGRPSGCNSGGEN